MLELVVQIEKLAKSVKVYNIEVDDSHTYFVANGVLVHNKCGKNVNSSEGGTGSNTYYHVITEEAAKSIMETGQLKNGKWESRVFAWKKQQLKDKLVLLE